MIYVRINSYSNEILLQRITKRNKILFGRILHAQTKNLRLVLLVLILKESKHVFLFTSPCPHLFSLRFVSPSLVVFETREKNYYYFNIRVTPCSLCLSVFAEHCFIDRAVIVNLSRRRERKRDWRGRE